MNEREIAIKSVLNAIEKVTKCSETCDESSEKLECDKVYAMVGISYDENSMKTDTNVYKNSEKAHQIFNSAVDSSIQYYNSKYCGDTVVTHNDDKTWFKITNTDKKCTEWCYYKIECKEII